LCQHSPTQLLCLDGKPTALIVGKSQSSPADVLSQNAIFLGEIIESLAAASGSANLPQKPRETKTDPDALASVETITHGGIPWRDYTIEFSDITS
jgi:hypothetical protein